ncbi:cobalamin synthesis protein P47K [Thermincola ferriacetica]|uniref:Cobalamin synthesis protein P47K n=1 Tax=Thermincola ferriacetica TaxID=281456 RepID=A0A0L6W1W4_9FIRM|nr:GTP-binding protein [Thermincola ferriacetica]KNZ69388.1 cobalamin synthesis protein P47K [Thermincola ferriacetica]
MKIKIISGFLGAGKTTCVKNVIKKAGGDIAVIVNEFGDVGIDAELVSKGDAVDMVELPSGCICCTLANDLVSAVKEIKTKYNPKRLVIEPSGLAVPSGILEALEPIKEEYGLEFEGIIGIIDADSFLANIHSGLFGDFYTDQLANSDIILINKIDLVNENTVKAIEEELAKHNQHAILLQTVNCETDLPDIIREHGADYLHLHFYHDFDSLAITSDKAFNSNQLEEILKEMKAGKYGNIYRAKGIYKTPDGGAAKMDYVQGNYGFEKFPETNESKLIFIGKEFDRKALEQRLDVL